MRRVEVVGDRLRLRELSADDVDTLLGVYGDPATTQHVPFEPRTRTEVAEIVAAAQRAAAERPRRLYVFAVAEQDTDEVIGVARLAVDRDHPHSAEIGFGLRSDQWGRGLGTELVVTVLRFGFGELGLHRIWGARAPENTAAQLVMLTAGMVEEGRIRHHVRVKDGWRDSVCHSILEPEWALRH